MWEGGGPILMQKPARRPAGHSLKQRNDATMIFLTISTAVMTFCARLLSTEKQLRSCYSLSRVPFFFLAPSGFARTHLQRFASAASKCLPLNKPQLNVRYGNPSLAPSCHFQHAGCDIYANAQTHISVSIFHTVSAAIMKGRLTRA